LRVFVKQIENRLNYFHENLFTLFSLVYSRIQIADAGREDLQKFCAHLEQNSRPFARKSAHKRDAQISGAYLL
jgi:hypothetical protein